MRDRFFETCLRLVFNSKLCYPLFGIMIGWLEFRPRLVFKFASKAAVAIIYEVCAIAPETAGPFIPWPCLFLPWERFERDERARRSY